MAYMASPRQMFGRASLFSPQGYGGSSQFNGFQGPMMPPGGPRNAQLIQNYMANRAPLMAAYQGQALGGPGQPQQAPPPVPVSSTAAIPRPPQQAPKQDSAQSPMRQWMRPAGTGGQQSVFAWGREAPGSHWRHV